MHGIVGKSTIPDIIVVRTIENQPPAIVDNFNILYLRSIGKLKIDTIGKVPDCSSYNSYVIAATHIEANTTAIPRYGNVGTINH